MSCLTKLAAFIHAMLCLMLVSSSFGQGVPTLVVQAGHGRDRTRGMTTSPDKRLLATWGDDGVRFWDILSGRQLREFRLPATQVAFNGGGQLFVLSSSAGNRIIRVFEIADGRELKGPTYLYPAVVPPSSKNLADEPDREVKLKNSHPGTETTVVGDEKMPGVQEIVTDQEGTVLVSGDDRGNVCFWNAIDRTSQGCKIRLPAAVGSLKFSPDGRFLVAKSEGGAGYHIFQYPSMTEIAPVVAANDETLRLLTFSSTGRLVAMAADTDDGLFIHVLDTATWLEVTKFEESKYVWSVGFSWDEAKILTAGWPARAIHTFDRHGKRLEDLGPVDLESFQQIDPRTLVGVAKEGEIVFWDTAADREIHRVGAISSGQEQVAIPDDESWMATSSGPIVRVWNLSSGKQVRTLGPVQGEVSSIVADPNGKWVGAVTLSSYENAPGNQTGGPGMIYVWDVDSGEQIQSWKAHDYGLVGIKVSSDGRIIAVSTMPSGIQLWNPLTAEHIGDLDGMSGAVPFSADGRLVATASNADVKLINGTRLSDSTDEMEVVNEDAEGEESCQFGSFIPHSNFALGMTPSGTCLFQVSPQFLYLKALKLRPRDHIDELHGTAFSQDGGLIAVRGEGEIQIWNTQDWHLQFRIPSQGTPTAFIRRSHLLIVSEPNGELSFIDIPKRRIVATLICMRDLPDSLVITPDGLFDGTADAMQEVAWRSSDSKEVTPLDAFFTDFFHPDLLAEILAGKPPKATVDIATALQVPGLRTMLAKKYVHPEIHDSRVVLCFEHMPGAVINFDPNDQRVVFPPVHGYNPGTTPTCKFEKELQTTGGNTADLKHQLQNWKPELVITTWDGKPSGTQQSTLHVLTVGVSQYPPASGFDPLPYAERSAKAIAAFFTHQGALANKPYSAIRVWEGLYGADATRQKLRQRWLEMAKAVGENDVVLLYLAGHGKVSPGQEMFYFVPVDGRDGDAGLRDSSVSTAMLAETLRNLPARRIVLIIDACQSGGAIEALGKIGIVKAQEEQWREQHEGAGHEHGVGVHLIAATLPLSYAVGLKEGRSALAEALLRGLQDGSGLITVDQLTAYLQAQLPNESEEITHGYRQVPLINSIGLDFAIATKSAQLDTQ